MEKTRQIKLLSIVLLVIAITGMTLGFAAFSTTLSISSSATVTPNSEDFKVVMLGSETDLSDRTATPKVYFTAVGNKNVLYNEGAFEDGAGGTVYLVGSATGSVFSIFGRFQP